MQRSNHSQKIASLCTAVKTTSPLFTQGNCISFQQRDTAKTSVHSHCLLQLHLQTKLFATITENHFQINSVTMSVPENTDTMANSAGRTPEDTVCPLFPLLSLGYSPQKFFQLSLAWVMNWADGMWGHVDEEFPICQEQPCCLSLSWYFTQAECF